MSDPFCEDCGSRKRNGICTNCCEELYILDYQTEDIDFPLSDEFLAAAAEQRAKLDREKKGI